MGVAGTCRAWNAEKDGKGGSPVLSGWPCCSRRRPRSSWSWERRRMGCASSWRAWLPSLASPPRPGLWLVWWRGSQSWWLCGPEQTGRIWVDTENTLRGQQLRTGTKSGLMTRKKKLVTKRLSWLLTCDWLAVNSTNRLGWYTQPAVFAGCAGW